MEIELLQTQFQGILASEGLRLWLILVHGCEECDHRLHILTDEIKRTNNSENDTSYEEQREGFEKFSSA